jgi:hypothetical protein
MNATQQRWADKARKDGTRLYEIPGNLFEFRAEACTISENNRFAQKRPEVLAVIRRDLAALRAMEPGETIEITEISRHPRHGDKTMRVTRLV